jgi:ADP-ribosyl-[dinitrogen reductase] hydrolase
VSEKNCSPAAVDPAFGRNLYEGRARLHCAQTEYRIFAALPTSDHDPPALSSSRPSLLNASAWIRTDVAAPLDHDVGRLVLLPCPGWGERDSAGTGTDAAMRDELRRIIAAGVTMLVTLLSDAELKQLGAAGLGAACRELQLDWAQCPIADYAAPGEEFEHAWAKAGLIVQQRLDRGDRVAIHCRAGIGRSGTIAARVLIERGVAPATALARVRAARPGAVETAVQEDYLAHLRTNKDRR